MYKKVMIGLLSVLSFGSEMKGHGFSGNTYVKTGRSWQQIDQVCRIYNKSKKTYISSYDCAEAEHISSLIKRAGESFTNCYFEIHLDDGSHDIVCTPTQEFYRMPECEWVPAYELRPGDLLLNEHGESKAIMIIEFIKKSLKVYALEIDKTHTFFVGRYAILTHNMILPALSLGFCFAFGTGAVGGAAAGSWMGPVGCAAGVALGSVVAVITKLACEDNMPRYIIGFDMCEIERRSQLPRIEFEDKAPGKPTENDGFIPKKNWDGKKVRHKKTGQVGWPDEKGNVWVPTGQGPLAHRGPHWDVINHKGRHKNVLPGGREC